jgi:hypothetical protein
MNKGGVEVKGEAEENGEDEREVERRGREQKELFTAFMKRRE